MNESSATDYRPGLSEEQIRFFKTFGYVVLKQVFTTDELRTIDDEFSSAMSEQYDGKPFDGTKRHWSTMMDKGTPFYASLIEDPRFLNVAKQLYGDDVLGIIVDANRYVGDTNWHRDTKTVLQYGVKFAFYLEPVDTDSGALRVIPGTHRLPDDEEFAHGIKPLEIGDVPAIALKSEPGDVVAFDLRLWHSSLGGSNDRRMCTVVYYNNPKTAEEEKYLQSFGVMVAEFSHKKFGCKRQHLYSTDWLENASANPDRRYWIERLGEIGFLDAPGLAEEGWKRR